MIEQPEHHSNTKQSMINTNKQTNTHFQEQIAHFRYPFFSHADKLSVEMFEFQIHSLSNLKHTQLLQTTTKTTKSRFEMKMKNDKTLESTKQKLKTRTK